LEIIVFRQLSKDEVKEIADIMLKEVFTRLTEQGITLDGTVQGSLGGRGLQPQLRSETITSAIMRLLEDSLAEEILSGRIKEAIQL